MLSKKKLQWFLLKTFGIFSVVRGYNILVIILAQYFSAIFIFAPQKSLYSVVFDWQLFLIVLASSLSIASGYIINNFYDAKKDLINRPKKSMIDRLVSQKTKLTIYFSLNFLIVFFAFFVSVRAVLFFSTYIFLLWFYSHKLKKIVIIGNITASLLAVLPFFAILLYYKNFYAVVFAHATFLFLLLFIREIIKDLENIKGDLATNYKTIPVVFGEKIAKNIIIYSVVFTLIPAYILVDYFDIGYMDIYFYFSMLVLLFFVFKLQKFQTKEEYLKLHFLLKVLIFIGILSVILINPKELAGF